MINMKEIFAYDRISNEECELAPLTQAQLGSYLLEDYDLLFARQSLTYEGAGKCSLVLPAPGDRTWESHLIRVRLNQAIASPGFYYYYFRSPQGRRSIESIVQQVAAAGIRGSDLTRLSVPFPPLKVQRNVAELLGALDDKIAANARLGAIADEVVAASFHKTLTQASYSDLSFADLARVTGGGTPSTKEPSYWGGDVPWATPTDVTALSGPYLESTSRTISEMGLAACASELYPAGSILMTSRATIGAFAIAQFPVAVNQGFIVVQANDPSYRYWLFHEMRSRVDEFISLANGATFLELSRGNFKKFKVRLPEATTVAEFNDLATALHSRAREGLRENIALSTVRDTLLPQLMSGQLQVRDAEELVEAIV